MCVCVCLSLCVCVCVCPPLSQAVLGRFDPCTEEMVADGSAPQTGAAAAAGAGAGAAAGGKKGKGQQKQKQKQKGGKQKGGKKAAAAADAAAAAPAPAPAPAPAKKEKKAGPFDGLAKSSMDGDEWKRTYSNSRPNYYAAMDWFWANLDTEGWSLWRCTYNYNSENKVAFMTSNLVGGYLQRCDEIRKFAFGSMVIVEGETYDVSGVWLIRGQSIQPMLDCNPDAEYYTWTKIENHGEDATRKMVGDYWCADEKLGDATLYDSKLFK